MRTIPIDLEIEGLDGELTLVEPSVAMVRSFIGLMETDTKGFMINVLEISLYQDGLPVEDTLNKVGLGAMMKILPKLTELLGFDSDPND